MTQRDLLAELRAALTNRALPEAMTITVWAQVPIDAFDFQAERVDGARCIGRVSEEFVRFGDVEQTLDAVLSRFDVLDQMGAFKPQAWGELRPAFVLRSGDLGGASTSHI